jgi:hypothetical protein
LGRRVVGNRDGWGIVEVALVVTRRAPARRECGREWQAAVIWRELVPRAALPADENRSQGARN